MCTVLLPQGVKQIAVKKYVNILIYKYLCFPKEDILTHETIEFSDCSVFVSVLMFIGVGFESS